MAYNLDDGEFWLPPKFLAEDDMFSGNGDEEVGWLASFNPGRRFSSDCPIHVEVDGRDTLCLTRLAERLSKPMLGEERGPSRTQESSFGRGCGCKNNMSRGFRTCDLFHHDGNSTAGGSAGYRVNNTMRDGDHDVYYNLKPHISQQKPMEQMKNHGTKATLSYSTCNQGGSSSCHQPHPLNQNQRRLGEGGTSNTVGRKLCAGTGVFLPRRSDQTTLPFESRKTSASPTVLLPARVVKALNLNLDEWDGYSHIIPNFKSGRTMHSERYFDVVQKRGFEFEPEINFSGDIRLPQEWTY